MDNFAVTASRPRSTTTGVDNGVDVDVRVTLAGSTYDGEVTLAPAQYDGRLCAYGNQPDMWISGALLKVLKRLGDADFRAALNAIEAEAADVAVSADV